MDISMKSGMHFYLPRNSFAHMEPKIMNLKKSEEFEENPPNFKGTALYLYHRNLWHDSNK